MKRTLHLVICLASLAVLYPYWPEGLYWYDMLMLVKNAGISIIIVGSASLITLSFPLALAVVSYLGSSHLFMMISPGFGIRFWSAAANGVAGLVFVVNIIPVFVLANLFGGMAPQVSFGQTWANWQVTEVYLMIILGLSMCNMIWTLQYRLYIAGLHQLEEQEFIRTALAKGLSGASFRRYYIPGLWKMVVKTVKPVFLSLIGLSIFFEYAFFKTGPGKDLIGGLGSALFDAVKRPQWSFIYLCAVLLITLLVALVVDVSTDCLQRRLRSV